MDVVGHFLFSSHTFLKYRGKCPNSIRTTRFKYNIRMHPRSFDVTPRVSDQGKRARRGAGSDGFGSVPGQLPEKTRDGQDWAEWAREWREDPQGKADRLVSQWDAEAKANESGGSQVGISLHVPRAKSVVLGKLFASLGGSGNNAPFGERRRS